MRIEVSSARFYLYLSFRCRSFYGEIGVGPEQTRVSLRLSTAALAYLWRAWRTGAKCYECGFPEWHWWRHSDCIPF